MYVSLYILFSWIATRPRVEWLGHMVCVCLTLETAKLFPRVIVLVYFSLAVWEFRSVSPHPFQHLLWSVFLMSGILIGTYCIGIVICICLITNDVERLFKCLFTVCVSLVSWCLTSLPISKWSSVFNDFELLTHYQFPRNTQVYIRVQDSLQRLLAMFKKEHRHHWPVDSEIPLMHGKMQQFCSCAHLTATKDFFLFLTRNAKYSQ